MKLIFFSSLSFSLADDNNHIQVVIHYYNIDEEKVRYLNAYKYIFSNKIYFKIKLKKKTKLDFFNNMK